MTVRTKARQAKRKAIAKAMVEAKSSHSVAPAISQRFKVSYGVWLCIVRFLEQLDELRLQ